MGTTCTRNFTTSSAPSKSDSRTFVLENSKLSAPIPIPSRQVMLRPASFHVRIGSTPFKQRPDKAHDEQNLFILARHDGDVSQPVPVKHEFTPVSLDKGLRPGEEYIV